MRKICLLVIIFIFNCGSEKKGLSAWDGSDGDKFKKLFIADCNEALKQKEYCLCVFEEIKSTYPYGPFSKINLDMESFAEECLYLKH